MKSHITFSFMAALAFLAGDAIAAKRINPADFPQRGPEWTDPAPRPVEPAGPSAYPAYAQIMGIEGSTTVGFTIDGKGAPRMMILLASAPRGVFDSACINHVRTFVYSPQTKNGGSSAHNRRWSFTCRYKFQH